jgi:glycosyltransferase involved in cell wall biosynthesis
MRIAGVYAPSSIGIARYCRRLGDALPPHGVEYDLCARPNGHPTHLHFGNSSRGVAVIRPHGSFVLTVHDVVPRARPLRPLQRRLLLRLVAGANAVVVHSRLAADLLVTEARIHARRLEVIPHGAPRGGIGHEDARRELGWSADTPVAVLPGVVKSAKLVHETVRAAAPLIRDGRLRLVLAGDVRDRRLAASAMIEGAEVLESPHDATYDLAVAAADIVLVLRSGTVGETNGPLLDALGAGRAILATPTGSIPEVADGAALLVPPTVAGIRSGLTELLEPRERALRESAAAAQGDRYSWDAVARAHAELFRSELRG